ncbi:MAG: DsbA family protein [Sphingomonas sp.]|nr:DsbA family protein [Sphingomonas sp.]
MKSAFALAVLPFVLLTSCGDDKSATAKVGPAAPVAAKPAPAGTNWVDVVSRTPEGGYRMGNPDAPVKLIEYGSRSCPHCALFDKEGVPALRDGPVAAGKVSYEFRDYPVHGAIDMGPILLGQCVEPAQFFPMLDQMMRAQQELLAKASTLTQAEQTQLQSQSPVKVASYLAERLGYLEFVKQRGVPEAKARACLSDQAKLTDIAKSLQVADQEYQVAGTPTFIVNGKVIANVNDWAGLKPALAAAGAL